MNFQCFVIYVLRGWYVFHRKAFLVTDMIGERSFSKLDETSITSVELQSVFERLFEVECAKQTSSKSSKIAESSFSELNSTESIEFVEYSNGSLPGQHCVKLMQSTSLTRESPSSCIPSIISVGFCASRKSLAEKFISRICHFERIKKFTMLLIDQEA